MAIFSSALRDDPPDESGYLEAFHAALERLHHETVTEIGCQPMPPETLSMLAMLLVSLPLAALLHPAIPLNLRDWQIGLAMAAVWLVAFFLQRLRYDRFQARLQRKVVAHLASEAVGTCALR